MNSRAREILRGVIHLWWIFVIVMPLTGFGLYLAIDHSNANQERALRHSNALTEAKFEQSLRVTNRKFAQSLRVAVYAINSNSCGFEHYGLGAISRAKKARDDPRSDARVVAASKVTIAQTRAFLRTNAVKVPTDFDCSTLPKNPPKP